MLSHRQAALVVKMVFDRMAEALVREEKIEIRGFGSFHVKSYRAYEGRNPRNGDIITVPEKRLPVFKTGKELAARLQHSLPKDEPE